MDSFKKIISEAVAKKVSIISLLAGKPVSFRGQTNQAISCGAKVDPLDQDWLQQALAFMFPHLHDVASSPTKREWRLATIGVISIIDYGGEKGLELFFPGAENHFASAWANVTQEPASSSAKAKIPTEPLTDDDIFAQLFSSPPPPPRIVIAPPEVPVVDLFALQPALATEAPPSQESAPAEPPSAASTQTAPLKRSPQVFAEIVVPEKILEHPEQLLFACCQDKALLKKLTSYAEGAGLTLHISLDEALLSKVTHAISPKLLVLDERASSFSRLHQIVYDWPLHHRLAATVILLSETIGSDNSAEAFAHSVDMIVAHEDLDKIPQWIAKVLAEKSSFLQFWNSEK